MDQNLTPLQRLTQKWTVMLDQQQNRHYLYGPLDDFSKNDLEGLTGPVPVKDWTAEDYLEILSNVTEDRNHHWLCSLFSEGFLKAITNAGLSPAQAKAFAGTIAAYMAEHIYKL